MEIYLTSMDQAGVVLALKVGNKKVLGRRAGLGVPANEISVSREHCTVTAFSSVTGQLGIRVEAKKRLFFVANGSQSSREIKAGQIAQLFPGDVLYLTCNGTSLRCGFAVSGPQLDQAEVRSRKRPSHGVKERPLKRAQPDASTLAGGGGLDSAQVPAGREPGTAEPAASGIFTGLTIVFWARKFVASAKERAAAAGADVADEVCPGATHIVAERDLSAQQATERLAGRLEHFTDFLQVHHDRDKVLRLPRGVHIVVPDWVSASLARGALQREEDHYVDLARLAALADKPGSHEEAVKQDRIEDAVASLEKKEAKRAAWWRQGTDLEPLPARGEAAEWELWQATPLFSQDGAGEAAAPAGASPGQQDPQRQQAAPPGNPQTSGPDGEARTGGGTGLEWGTGGVWTEPFDEAAAKETLDRLARHWHRQDLGGSSSGGQRPPQAGATPAAHPPQDAATGLHAADDVDLAQRGGEQAGDAADDPGGGGTNSVCTHAACAVQDICIIAQLLEVKDHYKKGKDQFRIKAIERTIKVVAELQQPLRGDDDCDALGIGEKSAKKLREIVSTGRLRRNQALAADPRQQAVRLFMRVWGTGEATAERWYKDGCRSLADVGARGDLTRQQRVGVRYFEDLQRRIPRTEVAVIEAAVRAKVVELLRCADAPDADRLFARAVGSYIRGKAATGDVDMLVLAPPSCGDVDPGQLLHDLITALTDDGLLLRDVVVSEPAARGSGGGGGGRTGAATFLGVCRHSSSPCVRRFDIKIYPRRWLPFAVVHFIGSGAVNRALRYWSRTADVAAQRAQRAHPDANGFKLSDYGLVPIRRKEGTRTDGGTYQNHEVELGASVECRTEADIFTALGLAYVPPHMRFFGPNFE